MKVFTKIEVQVCVHNINNIIKHTYPAQEAREHSPMALCLPLNVIYN